MIPDAEQQAVRTDAEQRLRELRAVRAVLWPDRDDPEILSEIVGIQAQIRSAEQALRLTQLSPKAAANA